jgi:hypothetical protein
MRKHLVFRKFRHGNSCIPKGAEWMPTPLTKVGTTAAKSFPEALFALNFALVRILLYSTRGEKNG